MARCQSGNLSFHKSTQLVCCFSFRLWLGESRPEWRHIVGQKNGIHQRCSFARRYSKPDKQNGNLLFYP